MTRACEFYNDGYCEKNEEECSGYDPFECEYNEYDYQLTDEDYYDAW